MIDYPEINAVRTHVGRWGGSAAIRVSIMTVEGLRLCEGEPVSVEIENNEEALSGGI